MTRMLAIRAFVLWLGLLALAMANGVLREAVLVPALGRTAGLAASGIVLCVLIAGATFLCAPWLRTHGRRPLLAVGAGWLVLTIAFEFGLGWIEGKPLTGILAAYTFRDGNLWPLALLVTATAPWCTGKLRGWF